jgi:hypothetical protein
MEAGKAFCGQIPRQAMCQRRCDRPHDESSIIVWPTKPLFTNAHLNASDPIKWSITSSLALDQYGNATLTVPVCCYLSITAAYHPYLNLPLYSIPAV